MTQGELVELARGWNAPAELGGGSPREVRYSATGIFVMVVMLALVVGGAALTYILVRDTTQRTGEAELLKAEGAAAPGKVTGLRETGAKTRSYLIAYEFEIGGNVYHGEASAPRSYWSNLQEGEPLSIRYAPSNPLVNRPANVPATDAPLWVILLIPVTFAGVSALLVYRVRKQRRLLEEGRPAPGVITKMRRTKNGRSIRYDFLLPGGGTATGSGIAKSGPTDPGNLITIVYDPENPSSSAPYPFELVKIVR